MMQPDEALPHEAKRDEAAAAAAAEMAAKAAAATAMAAAATEKEAETIRRDAAAREAVKRALSATGPQDREPSPEDGPAPLSSLPPVPSTPAPSPSPPPSPPPPPPPTSLPPPPPPTPPTPSPPRPPSGSPWCVDAERSVKLALEHSKTAMEDFLLRGAKRSASGIHAMRLLKHAIECDPSHAKLWYRLGFLLQRQARLPAAATLALEHAAALKPSSGGPPAAELTLVHLEALVHSEGEEAEADATKLAKRSHAAAMKLNPQITIHTLKAAYGEAAASGAFADVLAQAMGERQARLAKRRQDEERAAQ